MRSFLLDVPGFKQRIGPVRAPTLRVASRLSNTLRFGRAASDYADFEPCPLVIVCVPDENLAEALGELAEAPLDWAGRSVILCDSQLSSAALKPLASLGAHTASASREAGTVIVDGHTHAVAEVKSMVGRSGALIRIAPTKRACLLHALTVAGLSRALAAIADEYARSCGLTAIEAKRLVETMLTAGVRDFVKSGRKVLINDPHPAYTKQLRAVLAERATESGSAARVVRSLAAAAHADAATSPASDAVK